MGAETAGVTLAGGDIKPEERQVEARSADDSMASMVRSLYFADTFIVNGELDLVLIYNRSHYLKLMV